MSGIERTITRRECAKCCAAIGETHADECPVDHAPMVEVEYAPAERLRGAVAAVRAHRDRWYEANSKSPEEARPSDRELWRVVLGSDAAGGQ